MYACMHVCVCVCVYNVCIIFTSGIFFQTRTHTCNKFKSPYTNSRVLRLALRIPLTVASTRPPSSFAPPSLLSSLCFLSLSSAVAPSVHLIHCIVLHNPSSSAPYSHFSIHSFLKRNSFCLQTFLHPLRRIVRGRRGNVLKRGWWWWGWWWWSR